MSGFLSSIDGGRSLIDVGHRRAWWPDYSNRESDNLKFEMGNDEQC